MQVQQLRPDFVITVCFLVDYGCDAFLAKHFELNDFEKLIKKSAGKVHYASYFNYGLLKQ